MDVFLGLLVMAMGTGGQGSALAGIGWFLGAMAAAGGVVVLATRRPAAPARASRTGAGEE